jgi:hypothetical protein
MCYAIMAGVGTIYVAIAAWAIVLFYRRRDRITLLPFCICFGMISVGMALLAFLLWGMAGCFE